ncbi:hypothetical protein PR048_011859, partial [Dryococelus australis]
MERDRRHWVHPFADARSLKGRFAFTKHQSTSLDITSSKPLPETESPNMSYGFVSDDAFSLSSNVMIPYSGNVLSDK